MSETDSTEVSIDEREETEEEEYSDSNSESETSSDSSYKSNRTQSDDDSSAEEGTESNVQKDKQLQEKKESKEEKELRIGSEASQEYNDESNSNIYHLNEISYELYQKTQNESKKDRKEKETSDIPSENDPFNRRYNRIRNQLSKFKSDIQNNYNKNKELQKNLNIIQVKLSFLLGIETNKELESNNTIFRNEASKNFNSSSMTLRAKTEEELKCKATSSHVDKKPASNSEKKVVETFKKLPISGKKIDLRLVKALYGNWCNEEDVFAGVKLLINNKKETAVLREERSKEEILFDTVLKSRDDELILSRKTNAEVQILVVTINKHNGRDKVIATLKARPKRDKEAPMKALDSFIVTEYELDERLVTKRMEYA